jgi:acylphosphatase
MEAARFFVGGRVQGVGFRAATRRFAVGIGLNGYVRNLADGRVEVFAQGDSAAIEVLAQWLQHGPPLARVDDVRRLPATVEETSSFDFG